MLKHKKTEQNTERLLPSDVGTTHPRISAALALRLYHQLELLEWIEEHPALITPKFFVRKKYPKDAVKKELTVLVDQFGEATSILRQLNKVQYYAALYLIENVGDYEEDQDTLYVLQHVIEFFERLYKQNII